MKNIYLFLFICVNLFAAEESSLSPKFNFFLDSYYSFGLNQLPGGASYFTTPYRNNEFNINLALIRGEVQNDNFRANLGFQAGTSVISYNLVEPTFSDLMKLIYEANVGVKLCPNLWLEGGIFPVDLAGESFISSKNLNYSRSMMADASPYFLNGVRATYTLGDVRLGASISNGYRILETNAYKSGGFHFEYLPTPKFSLTYHMLMGEESRWRMLNNVILKYKASAFWETNFLIALSFQTKPEGGHYAYWFTLASSHRFKLTDVFYIGGRVEYFFDKYQTLYITNTLNGMQAFGASANLDTYINKYLLWRLETRYIQSMDSIFNSLSGAANQLVNITSSFAINL